MSQTGGVCLINQEGNGWDAGTSPNQFMQVTVEHRPCFAHALVSLPEGTTVLADKGSMIWMDGNTTSSTWCHGGCCNAYCRFFSYENCCMNEWTGGPGGSEIAFADILPGDILPFGVVKGHGWTITSGAFLCGTPNCVVGCRFAGCSACCCSGEGIGLTTVSVGTEEPGVFYAGGYGQIQRHAIENDKQLFINNGLFFAAAQDIVISIGMPGGCYSCICSGEGLVMKFAGPLIVYTQNRDGNKMMALLFPSRALEAAKQAAKIAQEMAEQKGGGGGGGGGSQD